MTQLFFQDTWCLLGAHCRAQVVKYAVAIRMSKCTLRLNACYPVPEGVNHHEAAPVVFLLGVASSVVSFRAIFVSAFVRLGRGKWAVSAFGVVAMIDKRIKEVSQGCRHEVEQLCQEVVS